MKHHVTIILVTRVDELAKVFEARRHESASEKNLVTLIMTEDNKPDGTTPEIIKQIEDLLKVNGVAGETRHTSFENDRPMEIFVFYLVHNLPRPSNGSSELRTGMFETAPARKIIAAVKNQLQSLFGNSSTPMELDYSVQSFGTNNATRTAYNDLVDDQVPCRDGFLKSLKLREKQSYRVIEPDEDSKTRIDREVATAGVQNGCRQIETDNLIVQSERLRSALQNADNLNDTMLNAIESNFKNIVLADARELEMAAKNEADRISNAAEARSLREQKEEFERYKERHASSVKEQRKLIDKQHQVLRQYRGDLLGEKGELDRWELAKAGNYRGKERSLEDRRRVLDHQMNQFRAVKEDFDRTNDLNACKLAAKEASLEKQRLDLEYVQLEVLAERERVRQQEIDNDRRLRQREISIEQDHAAKVSALMDMERKVQRDYAAKVSDLREMENAMADRSRGLGQLQQELLWQKEQLENNYSKKADELQEIERSVEEQRRAINRDRSELSAREEELAETEKTKETEAAEKIIWRGCLIPRPNEIEIIPSILYLRLGPWFQR